MSVRARSISARIGTKITLVSKFFANGQLFNPFSVSSVKIYDSAQMQTIIATLPAPTQISQGVYQTTWNIPVGLASKTYFEAWTWQANSSMPVQIRLYSFRVDGSEELKNKPQEVPLFITPKEVDFFNGVAKEMIQRVIGQKITYYSISLEHTKTDELYNEALRKTVWKPVEINALVLFQNPVQTTTNFGIDTIYSIEIYFHKHELLERKIIPREGDFVKFGEVFYEIEQLTEPQIVYGQIQNKVMTKAVCRVSRESQFNIEE